MIIARILLITLVLTNLGTTVFASSIPQLDSSQYGPYQKVKVLGVIDGDTIRLQVIIWPLIQQNIILNLRSVDAPEITTGLKGDKTIPYCERREGKKAKRFTESFLHQGKVVLSHVNTGQSPHEITGELWVNNQSLSQALLGAHMALSLKNGEEFRIWPCKQKNPY